MQLNNNLKKGEPHCTPRVCGIVMATPFQIFSFFFLQFIYRKRSRRHTIEFWRKMAAFVAKQMLGSKMNAVKGDVTLHIVPSSNTTGRQDKNFHYTTFACERCWVSYWSLNKRGMMIIRGLGTRKKKEWGQNNVLFHSELTILILLLHSGLGEDTKRNERFRHPERERPFNSWNCVRYRVDTTAGGGKNWRDESIFSGFSADAFCWTQKKIKEAVQQQFVSLSLSSFSSSASFLHNVPVSIDSFQDDACLAVSLCDCVSKGSIPLNTTTRCHIPRHRRR